MFDRRSAEKDAAVEARLRAILHGQPRPSVPRVAEMQAAPPASPVGTPDGRRPNMGEHGVIRAALEARLPGGWRAALLDPSRPGVRAIVALAAAAVAVSAWLFWRARPQPTAVDPPVVVTAASAAPSPALLVVDVSGAVRRPGLVRLPSGARVADAILAAGGVRPGASTAGVNLARKVNDGEQIVVGASSPPAAGAATAGSGALLDLNSATLEQLEALPGVGPVLAQRILDWRTNHGRFASVEQLQEVEGIGPRKYESIRTRVTV